ncbi:MAG: AGE family epimerase/isomerase [Oscillospiraceae bacterium]|nr:AGE family epimerase/isomerase [Oscillospiraceae bacterium]
MHNSQFTIHNEIKNELINHIIPFWNNLADYENGGFYGYMDYDLNLNKKADKGVILHSRILWFYSNCYLTLKDPACLELAKHCFDFLTKHCVDNEFGGVYWLMSYDGNPVNTMKHGYNHAFFIYALSSYYDASGDNSALELAMKMFGIVEEKFTDDVSYREACTREWEEHRNDELSENGIYADKTMNTVLHLIEAYTELYRVHNDKCVAERLEFMLNLTYDKIYDKPNKQLKVFFDKGMNVLGNVHSYGHDIEAAWLIGRAIDVAEKALPAELCGNIREMNRALAERIDEVSFDGFAMNYECDNGVINKKRVWWAQAEALVGFLDAYRLYGEQRYLKRAEGLWEYIKTHVVDKRDGGEWYSELDEDNTPYEKPTVDEWKCPYHNGRMCLEAIHNAQFTMHN